MLIRAVCLGLLGATLAGCDGSAESSGILYVDPSAVTGGDGSAEQPYVSVVEALQHEAPFTHVMMAAGDVMAPSQWAFTAPVTLVGWGHAEVHLVVDGEMAWSAETAVGISNVALGAPVSLVGGPWTLTGVDLESSGESLVVSDGSLDLVDSTVTCSGERAVLLENSTGTVRRSVLVGGTRTGLAALAESDVTVVGSDVSGANINLFVSSSSLTVQGSEVHGAAYTGVLVGESSHFGASDSSFRDNSEGHISALGPDVSVDIARIVAENAPLDSCISVTGTDLPFSIVDSTLRGCAGAGVSAYLVADATVTGNHISEISMDLVVGEMADGISILDTVGHISGNTIEDVAGNGIAVLRASAQVEDNIILSSGDAGIDVVDQGGPTSVIYGNRIEDPGTAGVVVLNAEAEVISNTVRSAIFRSDYGLGDGIAFGMGATVEVRENDIATCERSGVLFMDGASGVIESNTFTENQRYGVVEFCVPDFAENTVVLGENTYVDNGLGDQSICGGS